MTGAEARTAVPRAPGSLSDQEFALFQQMIEREAGIHLAPMKKALLVGRLSRRLRELGLPSFARYLRVVKGDLAERTRMLDCICTNETHFFREPRHFELLRERLAPEWKAQADAGLRARRIRVWSAACSTGEEPYSLAMELLWSFPPWSGWEVEIFATDLSTRALGRARAGIWPAEKASAISPRYLKAFMMRGVGTRGGKIAAGPELRGVIRFARVNLSDATWPAGGPYDAIFCRNVLIYFDQPLKHRVTAGLLERLAPGGYLFLGHAESLVGMARHLAPIAPTVYREKGTG